MYDRHGRFLSQVTFHYRSQAQVTMLLIYKQAKHVLLALSNCQKSVLRLEHYA